MHANHDNGGPTTWAPTVHLDPRAALATYMAERFTTADQLVHSNPTDPRVLHHVALGSAAATALAVDTDTTETGILQASPEGELVSLLASVLERAVVGADPGSTEQINELRRLLPYAEVVARWLLLTPTMLRRADGEELLLRLRAAPPAALAEPYASAIVADSARPITEWLDEELVQELAPSRRGSLSRRGEARMELARRLAAGELDAGEFNIAAHRHGLTTDTIRGLLS